MACHRHRSHSVDVRQPPEWVELTSCPSCILGWPPEPCDSGNGLTWGCSHALDDAFKHPETRAAFPLRARRWSLSSCYVSWVRLILQRSRFHVVKTLPSVFGCWGCKPVLLTCVIHLEGHGNSVPRWSSRMGPKGGTLAWRKKTWALALKRPGFRSRLCCVYHKVVSDEDWWQRLTRPALFLVFGGSPIRGSSYYGKKSSHFSSLILQFSFRRLGSARWLPRLPRALPVRAREPSGRDQWPGPGFVATFL